MYLDFKTVVKLLYLKDSQFREFTYAGRHRKGTVQPEKICLRVVSLD